MRRFFLKAAVLALAAACPSLGWAGDHEIAQQISQRLQAERAAGTLKGFKLDMKVDQGVVIFSGNVASDAQKSLVLSAAEGLDGVANVVDQINITQTEGVIAAATPVTPATENIVSLREFLSGKTSIKPSEMESLVTEPLPMTPTQVEVEPQVDGAVREQVALEPEASVAGPLQMPGSMLMTADGNEDLAESATAILPASANEAPEADEMLTSAIVHRIGQAQRDGQLRGFGVDISVEAGDAYIDGRAASEQQKALILDLARHTPGVQRVIDQIEVFETAPVTATAAAPSAQPMMHPAPLPPAVMQQAIPAEGQMVAQQQFAQQQFAQQPLPQQHLAQHVVGGGPVAGQPVPMAPYASGAATPRYDQPYLPNYAWPGYAAYPNYAAVTYPQQYSPSAWPYIGPFYPYPQVPLGWRKVSLEWDDGWWFLDFSSRNGRHK